MFKKRLFVIGMAALTVFAMAAFFGCAFEPGDTVEALASPRTAALPGAVPSELTGTWEYNRTYKEENKHTTLLFLTGTLYGRIYMGTVWIAGNDIDSGPDPEVNPTGNRARYGDYTFNIDDNTGHIYGLDSYPDLGNFKLDTTYPIHTLDFDYPYYFIYDHPAVFVHLPF